MTASIDEKTVKYVANLAMLDVPENTLDNLTKDFADIFQFINTINDPKLKIDNISHLAHPLSVDQRFRADKVSEQLDTHTRELFQENAPKVEGGLYIVPTVLEENE